MRAVLRDELNEARKLIGSVPAASQSREQKLAKMCEKLQARLQQYKMENEQLEEMLEAAETKADEAVQDKLKATIAELEQKAARAERVHAAQMDAKAKELESLSAEVQKSRQSATSAEQHLASLESQTRHVLKERNASEERLLSSLREELAAEERRLEEERQAHKGSREQAARRERELESTLADNAQALSAMQSTLDERHDRVADLERKVAVLESDSSALASELAAADATVQKAKHQSGHAAELEGRVAGLQGEVAALQADLDGAKTRQSDTLSQVVALQTELADARRELAKQGPAAENERKVQELTELLYQKQTQLENLAADKAAALMTLERQLADARAESERSKTRQRIRAGGDIEEVVPMDSIGPVYSKLASHKKVGKYISSGARFLDVGASTLSALLKQKPLFRLVVFVYVLGVHAFIWLLLQKLQAKALRMEGELNMADDGTLLP